MTSQRQRHWEHHRPIRTGNLPLWRNQGCAQYDHRDDYSKRQDERQPETPEDSGHFFEKVGAFDLLFRGLPLHVVGEKVGEESGGEMDA